MSLRQLLATPPCLLGMRARTMRPWARVAPLALLCAPLATAQDAPQRTWTVFAEKLHTSTGKTIENALVQVVDGKISAILPGRSVTDDALRASHVTAGMVDASLRITSGDVAVEQSREVTPELSVGDAFDAFDPRWDRVLATGVTSGLLVPPDEGVISGFAVALKTGGANTLDARMLTGTPILRGAMGDQPSGGNSPASGRPTSFFNRRPTTRMGVEWEWRNAFFNAAAAPQYPELEFTGADVLRAALAGNVKVSIQAWTTADIRTAIFLKEEMQAEGFGEMRLVIDAAAEAWKEPELVVRSGASLVLPPFPHQGRIGESAMMAWKVAKQMVDRGVVVALSAQGNSSRTDHLGMQAGYAMRGGLTFEEALAAVTIQPARILGIEGRVGSIEIKKDADLVLWSGVPFEPSSRVIGVMIDGELAVDPR